jgi:acyl-coenzyme A synthetase/AMP-(fatty) acid ligase
MLNHGGLKFNPERIEKALEGHPQVQEAIVLTLPAVDGTPPRFIAAVIPNGPPPANLRAYLAENLGHPMPNEFIFMHDFPRNPNGKVVRQALQEQISKTPAQESKTTTLVNV